MASKYLCNLIVPGAAKSGTSSLHEYLNSHPMIAMSSNKEPHHFCRVSRYAQGAEAHNALFEGVYKARFFGESSTGYLSWPEAPKRIVKDLNEPKAIILLRHPVARSFSHYRWRYRLGWEKRSFLEALVQDGYGYDPEKPSGFGYMAYLEFSNYSRHCPIWENYLGAENCLILAAEDLFNNREKALETCFDFLGMSPLSSYESLEKVNQTENLTRYPPKKVTELAAILPSNFKSSRIYGSIRDLVLKTTTPRPPATMTNEERAFVEERLAEDIAWYESRFPEQNKFA